MFVLFLSFKQVYVKKTKKLWAPQMGPVPEEIHLSDSRKYTSVILGIAQLITMSYVLHHENNILSADTKSIDTTRQPVLVFGQKTYRILQLCCDTKFNIR